MRKKVNYAKFQIVNFTAPDSYFVHDDDFAPTLSETSKSWRTQSGLIEFRGYWETNVNFWHFSGDGLTLKRGSSGHTAYYVFTVKDNEVDPYQTPGYTKELIHGITYTAKIIVRANTTVQGSIIFGVGDSNGNNVVVGSGKGIRINDSDLTEDDRTFDMFFKADRNRPSICVVAEDSPTSFTIRDITVEFERADALLKDGTPSTTIFPILSSPQISPRINLDYVNNKKIRCDRRISQQTSAWFFMENNVVHNSGFLEAGEKILIKDAVLTVSDVEEQVQFIDLPFPVLSTAGYTDVSTIEDVPYFSRFENIPPLKLFPLPQRKRSGEEGETDLTLKLSIEELKGDGFPGVPCGTVFLDQIDLHSRSSAHEINDGRNAIFNVIVHEILHAIGISSFMSASNGFVTESYPSSCTIDVVNEKYKEAVSQKISQLGLDINDFYIDSLPMESGGAHVAEYAKSNNGKIQAAFKNDIMSPLYDFDRAIITPVTLSLLEGYLGYNVDYSLADGINLLELHIDTSVSNTPGSSSYDTIRTCSCCFHDEKIQINSDAKINNSIDIKRAT